MTMTETQATNRIGTEKRDVDERLRQAILDKKQAQIEAWTIQIEQLRERLQTVAGDVRSETEQHLNDLIAAKDQAIVKLEQLKKSTQQTWADVLSQTDEAFQNLADRFHRFAQKQS